MRFLLKSLSRNSDRHEVCLSNKVNATCTTFPDLITVSNIVGRIAFEGRPTCSPPYATIQIHIIIMSIDEIVAGCVSFFF